MDDIDTIKAQWAQQRPDLDTDPMALIGQLMRVSQHLSRQMADTFAQFDLTSASFDVLATLLRSGPPHALSPNQLLSTMMITSGTMTNRIDQLEKQQLVKRIRSTEDRRSVQIALTDKGRRLIDEAVTAMLPHKRVWSLPCPRKTVRLWISCYGNIWSIWPRAQSEAVHRPSLLNSVC